MNAQQKALLALGRALRAEGYEFVAPTPLTYKRVLSRPWPRDANPLTEVFGWNRPFDSDVLPGKYRELLVQGGLCEKTLNGFMRSLVRFSSLGGMLFAHSAFPSGGSDSVFFGPDSYRFCRGIGWVAEHDPVFSPKTLIDIGGGSGVGGLYAGRAFPEVEKIILSDINEKALQFAHVNAALNESTITECIRSDILAGVPSRADLIVSNPPYLVDVARRTYRHGGGSWGCDLAVRITDQALSHLTEDGRLLLYTGSPIVQGTDMFLQAITPLLRERTIAYRYEETDPDVFGEELELAPYDKADRIAIVLLYVKAADLIR